MATEKQKAELTAIFEEFFAEIALTRKETRLLREEVQNLSTDLSLATENMKGWTNHLEEIFSQGVVVQVMMKEINQLIGIRSEIQDLLTKLNAKFEMVQKPQKRRWFGR